MQDADDMSIKIVCVIRNTHTLVFHIAQIGNTFHHCFYLFQQSLSLEHVARVVSSLIVAHN